MTEHPTQQPRLLGGERPGRDDARGPPPLPARPVQLGLQALAGAGESAVDVNSSTGLAAGQQVQIGTGPAAETRTIAAVTNTGATGRA